MGEKEAFEKMVDGLAEYKKISYHKALDLVLTDLREYYEANSVNLRMESLINTNTLKMTVQLLSGIVGDLTADGFELKEAKDFVLERVRRDVAFENLSEDVK